MSRKPFESEYLYGMHDPGGEYIMREAGRKGWILFTEEIGHNPSHYGGTNYRRWSDEGFGILVRLNNGYYPRGTIPYSDQYENFSKRCASFVAGSAGAHMWIIGNEMNFAIERPQDRQGEQPPSFSISPAPEEAPLWIARLWRTLIRWIRSVFKQEDPSLTAHLLRGQYTLAPGRADIAFDAQNQGQVITPAMYAHCYSLCRNAIRAVSGHENDLVLIGAVAPWNINTGDWIQYFRDILTRLGPDGCDGITLHTYTHGYELRLITEDQFMDPPFDRYRFNFRCYIDFMEAIPANMRHLPVYVTETDQDEPWLDDGSIPWIQRAYDEIDRWNREPGRQQIRSMVLYRWPRVGGNDRWWIKGKGNVIADFRRAMEKGHKWNPDAMPVEADLKFAKGQQVFVAIAANIRRTPGWLNKPQGDVLGQLALRTPAVIRDGPIQKDTLTWWTVSSTLSNGTPVEGWVADALTDGRETLSVQMPPLPVAPGDDTFGPGAAVTIVSPDAVNVRHTPGHRNKPQGDVVASAPPATALSIVQGPAQADGLFWWQISGTTAAGTDINGWVAEAAPNGVRLLALEQAAEEKFAKGQQVFVALVANIRRTPGWLNKPQGDVLGQLALRTPAVIRDGPIQKDTLTWWTVSSTLSNGTPVEGWVADALTDGRETLSVQMPPLPVAPGDDTFGPGAAVTIVSPDAVNVRHTPGHRNKPQGDVVASAPPATALSIVQGPAQADGLFWWQISGTTAAGTDINGWVAEAAPNGVRLLAPARVAEGIKVGKPFQGQVGITQGWGSNPAFYSQFKYDGVPLKGHNGLDFGTPMRTPLIAADEGSVLRIGFEPGGFGHFILLRHNWGESLYAHLEEVHVQRDQAVSAAQVIGLSGNTGASTGPHLHFGIRINPYRRTDGWGGFASPIPFMDVAGLISFGVVEETDPTPLGEETLENPRP